MYFCILNEIVNKTTDGPFIELACLSVHQMVLGGLICVWYHFGDPYRKLIFSIIGVGMQK